MFFSQTSEYALRSVVCLADHAEVAMTTGEIASISKVPSHYLSKVLQALGRAGIVKSQRGLHGGFALSRDPKSLSMLEIINAVDPIQSINSCPLNLESHGTNLCLLHQRLNDSITSIKDQFQNTTVQELLRQTTGSRPLCEK